MWLQLMRVNYTLPTLPHHPLLRALVLAGVAVLVIGLVTLGLVVGAFVLAAATVVLVIRRWLARRAARQDDPSVIEGEYTVVSSHSRASLPRGE
jgi:membrane protein implicated in regulation of membrane protease activity